MRNKGKKLKKKMGRAPCCIKGEVKKGAWTPEEDKLLVDYITNNGHGTWRSFPKAAGFNFFFHSISLIPVCFLIEWTCCYDPLRLSFACFICVI